MSAVCIQGFAQQLPTRRPARQGYQPRSEQTSEPKAAKTYAVEDDPESYTSVFSFGITTNTNSTEKTTCTHNSGIWCGINVFGIRYF